MINDRFFRRSYIIAGIAILVVFIYLVRLFMLQIVDQSTKQKADSNALVRQIVYPSRGLIYDRNGQLLVFNQPIYEVTVIPREMRHHFDTLAFCQALHIDSSYFHTRMAELSDRKRNRGYSAYTPQVFMSQLSKEDVSSLSEVKFQFPGVNIRHRTLRDYTYNAAAHVLGSVGEVNQQDLDRDPYYQIGDYSGRDGLERQYESILRGEKGVEVLMRDARGRIQGSYHEGELDSQGTAGQDLTLTIDIHLQILAEQLLGENVGSVVAIEPKTGEILVLASAPGWDPKTLVGRQRGPNYSALLDDPRHPIMNRATQALYPPGSTFKLLQALVGLQSGAISTATLYPCSGPSSTPIKCTHNHGSPVTLEGAIEQSCNPYFWGVFRDILQLHGYGKNNKDFRQMYNQWRDDILSFGLGSKFTDSDVPNQVSGSIPSAELYDKFYGKTGWKAITIRSLSIGQGEILVTPLQLANQAACIANSGYYITPHLVRTDSTQRDQLSSNAPSKHFAAVSTEHFAAIQQGMHRVMTNGTGRWYNVPELGMCGKTGTVQNPHGKDHAIFIGFAPLEDPKIAVAVVVENVGFGATWACPIATKIMREYLTDYCPTSAAPIETNETNKHKHESKQ